MALLDMSDALLDPMFLDTFKVLRRQEVMGENGRGENLIRTYNPVYGTVTMSSPSDLGRDVDFQATTRSISVVLKFQLQSEVTGFQADVVVWRGDNYVVRHVDYYPQFGAGFYQAECESMDKTDVNPAKVRV